MFKGLGLMINPYSKSSSNEALPVSFICPKEASCFSSVYPAEVNRAGVTEIVDELLLA